MTEMEMMTMPVSDDDKVNDADDGDNGYVQ